MNIFEFTDNGVTYLVRGPAESTVEQAREIFNQQLNSGSLVTIEPGRSLTAINQASQGLPAAVAQVNIANLQNTLKNSVIQTDLSNVAIDSGITASNFVKQGATTLKIGSLDNSVVQGLLSQTNKTVGQTLGQLTNQAGLGKFGLNAEQLEKQGFLKPNVAATIARSGGNLVDNLASPTVWSGKLGINNVTDLLSNNKMQNTIQQGLMSSAYKSLQSSGSIQNLISDKQLAGVLNTATKFGTESAVKLIKGQLSGAEIPSIASFAKVSEFSASFGKISANFGNPTALVSGLTGNLSGQLSGALGGLTGNLSSLTGNLGGQLSGALGGLTGNLGGVLGGLGGLSALGSFGGLGGGNPLQSGIKKAKAVFNTVNRKTVNASVQNILGDAQIPTPDYFD